MLGFGTLVLRDRFTLGVHSDQRAYPSRHTHTSEQIAAVYPLVISPCIQHERSEGNGPMLCRASI